MRVDDDCPQTTFPAKVAGDILSKDSHPQNEDPASLAWNHSVFRSFAFLAVELLAICSGDDLAGSVKLCGKHRAAVWQIV